MNWQVIQGDSLVEMAKLPPNSVDACITDPPYGTTACSWDSVIPFAPMWAELKRIVKPKGAIVLFGSQPFTSALVMSNPQMFKYEWIWDKVNRRANYQNANIMPLTQHANILVFYCVPPTFNKQFRDGKPYTAFCGVNEKHLGKTGLTPRWVVNDGDHNPVSIIPFEGDLKLEMGFHPTQKPVDLLRYLVRTYTNAGDTVLDFTCGSGTTGVACAIEGRNSINIEQDAGYCEIARARIMRASGIACDIPKRSRPEVPLPLFEAVA